MAHLHDERKKQELMDLLHEILFPAYEPGSHKHKCGECGVIWEHADPRPGEFTEAEYAARHACPQCGIDQRWKYGG